MPRLRWLRARQADLKAIHRGAVNNVFLAHLCEELTGDCPHTKAFSDSPARRATPCRCGCGRARHLNSGGVTIPGVSAENDPADLGARGLPMATVYRRMKTMSFERVTGALQRASHGQRQGT